MARGTYIRTIKLNNIQPKRIVITKGIGKIVVLGISELSVYSLTGEFLTSLNYDKLFGVSNASAVCMCPLRSSIYLPDDSIAICDSGKRAFIVNTEDLSIVDGKPIAECSSTPVCVHCIKEPYLGCAICIVTDNGSFSIIHLPSK